MRIKLYNTKVQKLIDVKQQLRADGLAFVPQKHLSYSPNNLNDSALMAFSYKTKGVDTASHPALTHRHKSVATLNQPGRTTTVQNTHGNHMLDPILSGGKMPSFSSLTAS